MIRSYYALYYTSKAIEYFRSAPSAKGAWYETETRLSTDTNKIVVLLLYYKLV